MKRIILASSSPRRSDLLKQLHLPFEVIAGDFEEDMTLPLLPPELAKVLSYGKAEVVARNNPDAVVIGADTFVVYNGAVLGKPHTKERAREMLILLSGKTHSIITGISVIDGMAQKHVSEAVVSTVTFRPVFEKEIEEYIATGEPLERAGGYAIQGGGAAFVSRVEGDYESIIGLPVKRLAHILEEFGCR